MRSNRQLTQFAIDRVKGYLMGVAEGCSTAGNTTVELDSCDCCERPNHIVVKLFDKEILRLYTSPLNNRTVVGMLIQTGDFYDGKGRPSRTTRERLNGLLDFACNNKLLPEGVRVFIREDGLCCIGKGSAARVFDATNPRIVLMAHPTDLVLS